MADGVLTNTGKLESHGEYKAMSHCLNTEALKGQGITPSTWLRHLSKIGFVLVSVQAQMSHTRRAKILDFLSGNGCTLVACSQTTEPPGV